MPALQLDTLTWAKIRAEIDKGRDTVAMALGSTEQHGRHLPLGTDAFLAPPLRVGCAEHHLAFAGTLSISAETFGRMVQEILANLIPHGFRRIVLLPTHGGNFNPLEVAIAAMDPTPCTEVTDLHRFLDCTLKSSAAFGISAAEAGAHAGEWETSFIMALHPDMVVMEEAEEGYVGDLNESLGVVFKGIGALDKNGVIGDPRPATAEAGKQYLTGIVEMIHQWLLAIDVAGEAG